MKNGIKQLLIALLYIGIFIFLIPFSLLHIFQKLNIPHPVFFAIGAIIPIQYMLTKIKLKKKHKIILTDIDKLNDKVEVKFQPNFNTYLYTMKIRKAPNILLELISSNYNSLHIVCEYVKLDDFDCDMFYPKDADFSKEVGFSMKELFERSTFRRKSQKTNKNMRFVFESIKILGPVMYFSNRKNKLRFRFYGKADETQLKYWEEMIRIAEKYNEYLNENGYYKA